MPDNPAFVVAGRRRPYLVAADKWGQIYMMTQYHTVQLVHGYYKDMIFPGFPGLPVF